MKLMEENGEEDGRWEDGYRFEKVVDEQGDERKEGSRVFLIGWRGEGERFFQKRGNLAPLSFAPAR